MNGFYTVCSFSLVIIVLSGSYYANSTFFSHILSLLFSRILYVFQGEQITLIVMALYYKFSADTESSMFRKKKS